jgi:hypothetical protein
MLVLEATKTRFDCVLKRSWANQLNFFACRCCAVEFLEVEEIFNMERLGTEKRRTLIRGKRGSRTALFHDIDLLIFITTIYLTL